MIRRLPTSSLFPYTTLFRSQTLHARGWTVFATISLPLMRPGLANAFLLGFIESLADFGNPLVLGGNFEVLSDRKSTRLNSSHMSISYAVFCLKKKKITRLSY